MKRIAWWLWAAATVPLITIMAVAMGLLVSVAVYVSEVNDCWEFLWENMGPDCMDRKVGKWRSP